MLVFKCEAGVPGFHHATSFRERVTVTVTALPRDCKMSSHCLLLKALVAPSLLAIENSQMMTEKMNTWFSNSQTFKVKSESTLDISVRRTLAM